MTWGAPIVDQFKYTYVDMLNILDIDVLHTWYVLKCLVEVLCF